MRFGCSTSLGTRSTAARCSERSNVTDKANRRALGIDIGGSISASRIIAFLAQLIDMHGRPQAIRCDNGPELASQVFMDWCKQQGIEPRHIQPGKPDQNAYIERFNRTYREKVLSAYLSESLTDVRDLTEEWLDLYDVIRPHDAPGDLLLARYRELVIATRNSSFELSN